MSQHFRIWRDKQTIQGLWSNCIWRDKQNQGKHLVFESKTRKLNCILHKNFWLDFIQTYTSRRVAILCIFCIWSHCQQNSTVACIAQTFTTTCHSTIIKHVSGCKSVIGWARLGWRLPKCFGKSWWQFLTRAKIHRVFGISNAFIEHLHAI